MPFYYSVTAKATEREDAIDKVKVLGPGRVHVAAITPLPNGFLAVSLVHLNRTDKRLGYTTILTKPEDRER
jgi:hypothetical protein